jgi:hypothetical protein
VVICAQRHHWHVLMPASCAVQRLGALQTVPHMPQLLLLVVRSTQMPLQSEKPLGHLQVPAWHVSPPVHVVPHLPQSVVLVCRSTHAVPQALSVAPPSV